MPDRPTLLESAINTQMPNFLGDNAVSSTFMGENSTFEASRKGENCPIQRQKLSEEWERCGYAICNEVSGDLIFDVDFLFSCFNFS